MIDVKELRYNNIVLSKGADGDYYPAKVVGIKKDRVDLESEVDYVGGVNMSLSGIKPVPLSESLLIERGFWHIEFRDKWQLDGFGFQLEDPERTDKSDGYGLLYGLVGHEFQRIKYLHQLQNLYFALTGKELPIKK